MDEDVRTETVRVTFDYDGDRLSLVDVLVVDAVVPPSEGLDDAAGTAGNWLDLLDEQGSPVHRQGLSPTLFLGPEAPPERPGGGPVRVTSRPRGTFSVLVPLPEAAAQLAVVGQAQPYDGTQEAAEGPRVLARVEVAELRRTAR